MKRLECENEECKVWVSMKIPDSWKGGEGMFKCGVYCDERHGQD